MFDLTSDDDNKVLQNRLKRSFAVFPSGRLHKGLLILKKNRVKYEGRILNGATTLMAETVLRDNREGLDCITFREFCTKVASDQEFRLCLTPLLNFLDGLNEIPLIDSSPKEIDFRWAKLIMFGSYLRDFIKSLDRYKLVTLLPEFELYEQDFLSKNPLLSQNRIHFEKAYSVKL